MDKSDISICNITNKENGENLTVYAEWTDLKLKLVITTVDNILEGEVLKQNFSSFAETFEKSVTEYLKETQDILAGKNNEIDFILKDEKFIWKKKKWSLGQIDVKPLIKNSHVSSLMLSVLNQFSQNIRNLSEAEEKCKYNEHRISELSTYNNEIIKKKDKSEFEWYKRSILMVNSKKEKIRDLKTKLEKYESDKDSIFDANTDNSESETEITGNSDKHRKAKRKSKCSLRSDDEGQMKKQKCNIFVQTESLALITDIPVSSNTRYRQSISVQTEYTKESPMEEKAIASTSKQLEPSNIGEDEETPDFLTDESECEVKLQFDDEKNHNETQENAITQEESSEELF